MYERHFPEDPVFEALLESVFDELKPHAAGDAQDLRSALANNKLLRSLSERIKTEINLTET